MTALVRWKKNFKKLKMPEEEECWLCKEKMGFKEHVMFLAFMEYTGGDHDCKLEEGELLDYAFSRRFQYYMLHELHEALERVRARNCQ